MSTWLLKIPKIDEPIRCTLPAQVDALRCEEPAAYAQAVFSVAQREAPAFMRRYAKTQGWLTGAIIRGQAKKVERLSPDEFRQYIIEMFNRYKPDRMDRIPHCWYEKPVVLLAAFERRGMMVEAK